MKPRRSSRKRASDISKDDHEIDQEVETAEVTPKKVKTKPSPKELKKDTSPKKTEALTRNTANVGKKSKVECSNDEETASPKSKKTRAKKTAKGTKDEAKSSDDEATPSPKPKTNKTKKATAKSKTAGAAKRIADETTPSKSAKKKVKKEEWRVTERDVIPRLWEPPSPEENSEDRYCFKIISWNVAGIRAVLKNHPDALQNLVKDHSPDVICLQETKLQEMHVSDPKLKLKGHLLVNEGYDSFWSCSTAKKGYSGTAVFLKRQNGISTTATSVGKKDGSNKKSKAQKSISTFFQPKVEQKGKHSKTEDTTKASGSFLAKALNVSYGLGKEEHDTEGRSITVDYPLFSLTNLYVPNSGAKLERLTYRTTQWDNDLLTKMKAKETERPVIWLGDLNVAHTKLDTWNEGAKHLAKSAGTTAEERESFEQQLGSEYVDIFRKFHPSARGHYTYWSQRAGNREPNKGLRLDYFICSQSLLDGHSSTDGKVVVRDSYMLPDQEGSDHCPIVLELEIN
eukprot:CAMPEP_0194356446 /NCGR_PEP_ID=MMETSP0174-20130528/4098_1 /TAXON_ID=216777 /ORGANISM="Proboscia alata, Strain PI-D3" /LENGTH=511 /DNA_ID=CAMNT_0039126047 /DNA_START=294 /DNA_END=1826 /DNA_ORIENTATION=+